MTLEDAATYLRTRSQARKKPPLRSRQRRLLLTQTLEGLAGDDGRAPLMPGYRPLEKISKTPPEPNDPIAVYLVMKPTPIISERRAAILTALFTIGAMIFGH